MIAANSGCPQLISHRHYCILFVICSIAVTIRALLGSLRLFQGYCWRFGHASAGELPGKSTSWTLSFLNLGHCGNVGPTVHNTGISNFRIMELLVHRHPDIPEALTLRAESLCRVHVHWKPSVCVCMPCITSYVLLPVALYIYTHTYHSSRHSYMHFFPFAELLTSKRVLSGFGCSPKIWWLRFGVDWCSLVAPSLCFRMHNNARIYSLLSSQMHNISRNYTNLD